MIPSIAPLLLQSTIFRFSLPQVISREFGSSLLDNSIVENYLTEGKEGNLLLKVKVTPGSSSSSVIGVVNDCLRVSLRSAPEKGKANKELVEVLAAFFNTKRAAIEVVSGLTSRQKLIRISNLDYETARKRLSLS
jgi:uncharacterized protein (TIGR00251 family)